MERLLKDAQEISGVEYDISNLNDVYEAIHVIQGELGITGTTAKEAGDTISGSIGMVKAAWDNLVTGLANGNADLDQLIEEVVNSVEIAATNILPAFEKAFVGIGNLIEGIAPIIIERLPELASQIIPTIMSIATQMVDSISSALPELISVVVGQIPTLIEEVIPTIIEAVGQIAAALLNQDLLSKIFDAGMQLFTYFGQGLIDNADSLIAKAIELISFLMEGWIEALPQVIDIGVQVIAAFVTGIAEHLHEIIPMAVQVIVTLVQTLISPDNISMLIDAALQLIMGLADGLIEALPILIEALPFIIEELVSSLVLLSGKLTIAAIELMIKLAGGLIGAIPDLIKAIPQILAALVMGLIDGGAQLFEAGKDLLKNLLDGFGHDNPVLGKFKEWFNEIGDFWEGAFEWGADLVDNFVDGITSHWKSGIEEIKGIAGDIADYIGFSEPEKGPLSNFHTFAPDMMNLFMKGIEDNENALRKQISSTFDIESNIKESAYSEPQGAPMGGIPLGYGSLQSTSERQPIYLQVGEEVFAKLVYNANIREGERVGVNLTEAVRV